MRYQDSELELIKTTFAENDDVLIALRKYFLQLPMTEVEKSFIAKLGQDKLILSILRKTFLPTIDGDAPFNQVIDLWMTVELKGKTPEEAYIDINARKKLISYLDSMLCSLEGSAVGVISFEDLSAILPRSEADTMLMNFIARNSAISHVEQQLSMLSILSGQKNETVEQTKERLKKDSSK